MATLYIRDAPAELHAALRRLAVERRSSVSAEALRLLARSLATDTPRIRELLDEIEATRPKARGGRRSAGTLVRADRDAR